MPPIYREIKLSCAVLLLVVLGGCAIKQLPGPGEVARPTDMSDLLYNEGEQAAAAGNQNEALAKFSQYLAQYPQGSHADGALLNIGRIYVREKALFEARAFYQRLIDQFPQSAAADQARLDLIDLLAAENRLQEAVESALALSPDQLQSETLRIGIWERLSDFYRALGQPGKAAVYEYRLYKAVPVEQKAKWLESFTRTVPQLSGQDIESLWDQVDDPATRADLMYQYAMIQVMAEKDESAFELLKVFLKTYPDHPRAAEAAVLIDTISKKATFEPCKVGCLLPLSGPYKRYGQLALQGIELALSQVQAGENPPPLHLVIKDSGSDDKDAVEAVRQLDEERVGIILGPIATAGPAAAEAQKRHIPMVTFTQKSDITDVGNYIFRHFITPQAQVRTLVDYFINGLGLRNFAVLYPRENYGQTFMNLFWDEVVREGGRMVGVEGYDSSRTDFTETIKKLMGGEIKESAMWRTPAVVRTGIGPGPDFPAEGRTFLENAVPDPAARLSGLYFQTGGREDDSQDELPVADFDVLFIPDAPKMAALILPQLAYHDVRDVYVAGTNLWHSDQLLHLTGDYAQNAVMVDGFFNESDSEKVRKFVQAYRELFNADPGLIEAFAYDTAAFIFDRAARPDIRLRFELRDALFQGTDFEGVTGPVSFAQNGEARKHLRLLRVQGNRFIEITHQ